MAHDRFPILNRRAALRVSAGLAGAALAPRPSTARTSDRRKGTAQSIIFLHQWGGPGHQETFDPKPDAPDNVRGYYKAIPTSVPGTIISESLPNIAKLAHQFAIVRCLHHTMKNH
ncbi:MAG: DUF1501 domain-containing protein, partial [Gemmataceae bacterium]